MVKKIALLILTVALLGSLMIVPVSAQEASLDSTKFFSVDYRTGNPNDLIGGLEPVLTVLPEKEAMDFITDETLNATVADFNGSYCVGYKVDYSKIQKDFTVEVYFKLGSRQKSAPWSMICGTTWMGPDNIWVRGFSLNTSSIAISPADGPLENQGQFIGTKRQYLLTWSTGVVTHGAINQSFGGNNKKAEKEALYDQWLHVVYTHDGQNEAIYFNGEKVYSGEAYMKEIEHEEGNEMAALFRIGGYNWANNWDMADMQCAFLNLYESAASEEEAANLYANVGVISSPNPTQGSEGTPVPSDDEGTPAPSGDEATPAPKDPEVTTKPTEAPKQDNVKTFDLGLVSLAVVTLSSAVVAKKRNKK